MNRDHSHRSALLKRQARERLRQMDRQIAAIDAALRVSSRQPRPAGPLRHPAQHPGVGGATAFTMLIEMPEIGVIEPNARQPRRSRPGRLRPRPHQRQAVHPWRPRHLRQALYMGALVAVRFNVELKARYDALRATGKPPKLALTAIMPKLLILANALLRDRRTRTEKLA